MKYARDERACKVARDDRVRVLAEAFHHLPDYARVPPAVVELLIGRSAATRWRLIKKGRLPAPGPDGSTAAGALRRALLEMGEV